MEASKKNTFDSKPLTTKVNPNAKTLHPRRFQLNFWTWVRAIADEAKKKPPTISDDAGTILHYIDNDIIVKTYGDPDQLNFVRKRDITAFGKLQIQTAQRFIFEILHELEQQIPDYNSIKNDVSAIGKDSFQKLKGINDIFMKHIMKGEPQHADASMDTEVAKEAEPLLLSLKRELLYLVRLNNQNVEEMLEKRLKLSKAQIADISLFSKFFKFDIAELNICWHDIMIYELSAKERKILLYELVFRNQYNKLSNSYCVSVPISELFDPVIYKGKRAIHTSHDRGRPGLVAPYKLAYLKFNHVLFEGIRTGSLPGIKSDDTVERQKIAQENAVELLTVFAANHAKRFTREELKSLGKEPLQVPITTCCLLTPFFFGREDRQAFEQESAMLSSIKNGAVSNITVDLHDTKEPINVNVKFDDYAFVVFGTNLVIKTLMMGSGYQRVLNCRKNGMHKVFKKCTAFMTALGQHKEALRKQLLSFFDGPLFNNREGIIFRESYGKRLITLCNTYMLMNEIVQQNQKKLSILEAEIESQQDKLEKKIALEWLPYFDDMTLVEYYYLTKIKSFASKITTLEDQIWELEEKSRKKQIEIVEIEFDLITTLQQTFSGKVNPPDFWLEYFELVLLEKDMFELWFDMKDLYHNKEHEKFSQHVIESTEVKEIDPYSIPVRVALLTFHMGEQSHFHCKSGKDRTGMMEEHIEEFAELHAQYGEYPRVRAEKEKYNNHRRQIQTVLSMNGSTLDITAQNNGIPGSKVDKAVSGRFMKSYFHKYLGLAHFEKIGKEYSSKDEWFKYM